MFLSLWSVFGGQSILTIEETDEQVEALGELGTALIDAKEWKQADIVLDCSLKTGQTDRTMECRYERWGTSL
jgi:uncharacterized protein HemY